VSVRGLPSHLDLNVAHAQESIAFYDVASVHLGFAPHDLGPDRDKKSELFAVGSTSAERQAVEHDDANAGTGVCVPMIAVSCRQSERAEAGRAWG
jgi:hypothetical protein